MILRSIKFIGFSMFEQNFCLLIGIRLRLWFGKVYDVKMIFKSPWKVYDMEDKITGVWKLCGNVFKLDFVCWWFLKGGVLGFFYEPLFFRLDMSSNFQMNYSTFKLYISTSTEIVDLIFIWVR